MLHQWKPLGHCIQQFLTDKKLSSTNKEYAEAVISVFMERQHMWFTNNLEFVASCILYLNWATFLMEYSDYSTKLAICTATVVIFLPRL